PEKNIARSVVIAAPIIALMFILGTSSVIAFTGFNELDLIGPVPQALRAGANAFGAAGSNVASVSIFLFGARGSALVSIYFTGNARLPMVAGWDGILPGWFSKLHSHYRSPVNSILFVALITFLFAIGSLLGVGAQEAFQLIDNAAGIFYGIAYLILFAIPLFGATSLRAHAPLWLRAAAVVGAAVTLLYVALTIVPIVPVQSQVEFAVKIIATTVIANLVGALIFLLAEKRGQPEKTVLDSLG